MKAPLDIIKEYIELLKIGHVKEGLREPTAEETAFALALLQAIAADIEAGQ